MNMKQTVAWGNGSLLSPPAVKVTEYIVAGITAHSCRPRTGGASFVLSFLTSVTGFIYFFCTQWFSSLKTQKKSINQALRQPGRHSSFQQKRSGESRSRAVTHSTVQRLCVRPGNNAFLRRHLRLVVFVLRDLRISPQAHWQTRLCRLVPGSLGGRSKSNPTVQVERWLTNSCRALTCSVSSPTPSTPCIWWKMISNTFRFKSFIQMIILHTWYYESI